MANDNPTITGVILAGGLAKRMGGGDKCLLPMGGKTLLQRSIERAQPQVSELLLSANGSKLRFARCRLPVVADVFPAYPGPLAGIHAALTYMNDANPDHEWLASFACDTPFFPLDLVARFVASLNQTENGEHAQIVVARSQQRLHPVFALWHASLRTSIEQLLRTGNSPRLQEWVANQKVLYVDFNADLYDPFFNINTPQDLYAAEAQLPVAK